MGLERKSISVEKTIEIRYFVFPPLIGFLVTNPAIFSRKICTTDNTLLNIVSSRKSCNNLGRHGYVELFSSGATFMPFNIEDIHQFIFSQIKTPETHSLDFLFTPNNHPYLDIDSIYACFRKV